MLTRIRLFHNFCTIVNKENEISPIYTSNFSLTSYLSIFIARVDDQQVFLIYNFHIFLVVRLHEQISDLTTFPCQGKASMPDFPWQGKFPTVLHLHEQFFLVKINLSRKDCSYKWGLSSNNQPVQSSSATVYRRISQTMTELFGQILVQSAV